MKFDMAVIHYTESDDVSAAAVDGWHKQKGFTPRGTNPLKYIGYHFLIRKSGVVELGRSLDVQPTHCPGYNRVGVLAICLCGSDKLDWYPTIGQYKSLVTYLGGYNIRPGKVFFHKDLYSTSCPGRLDKHTILDMMGHTVPKKEEAEIMIPCPVGTNHVFPDIWQEHFQTYYLHMKNEVDAPNTFTVIATEGKSVRRLSENFTAQRFELLSVNLKQLLSNNGYMARSVAITVQSSEPSAVYVREA